MLQLRLTLLSLLALTVRACPGIDHEHGLGARSDRTATQPSGGLSLLRPLTWGDVNVVATTDIHGWYQGHLKSSQPEPNYSGDWGDFASFVYHLRREAKKRGKDLLLVDSGDLHDGAGLSDADPKVDGHVSNEFHSMVQYDALAVGNHELYIYADALDTYKNFRPAQNGRYMASNVNISMANSKGTGNVTIPFGERFVKFKTDNGRKVTSLGVLYNFTGADKGLTVQDPAAMVKESWFKSAIKDEPDFFLLVGHMPVRNDQWPVVVNAIRAVHAKTPILIFGGHTHIRDCLQEDGRSMSIESGRYLETIGWMSVNLTTSHNHPVKGNLSFSRSYIDANRRNYAFHAGLTESKLDTTKGVKITSAMGKVAKSWNLTHVYGLAPQDYFLDRYAASSKKSLLSLLGNKVLPTVISTSNPSRKKVPNIVLANSGSQRFDIYAGNFTRNDQYIVSPFTDRFLYLANVEWRYAQQLIGKLNGDGAAGRRSFTASPRHGGHDEERAYAHGDVDRVYNRWRKEMAERQPLTPAQQDLFELDARASSKKATLGYVTDDSCPGVGDDTKHVAIPFVTQPDFVVSPLTGNTTAAKDTTKVDVIMVDFILSQVIGILNSLQSTTVYTAANATDYNTLTTQDMYPLYFESL